MSKTIFLEKGVDLLIPNVGREKLDEYRLVEECKWRYFDDGFYSYETGCGRNWYFLEGSAEENKCNYCPYCGNKIVIGDTND